MTERFEGRLIEKIGQFHHAVNEYYSTLKKDRTSILKKLSEIPVFNLKEVIEEFEETKEINGNSKTSALEGRETRNKWYLKILEGKRVVGVDGSQINPLKDVGIPIGGVQVAKLCVEHGDGIYKLNNYSALVDLGKNVALKRFELEVDALIEEMDGTSWLFFDGALSTTFTADMSDNLKMGYFSSINTLIKASEDTKTPLISYIDRSYSKDIAKMLGSKGHDSFLLDSVLNLWSYTRCFSSENYCFSYLKTNPGTPIRIEYPKWMENMHHEVAKIVFAECQLGSTRGYPYILERAHSCCQITNEEKRDFMRTLSQDTSFKWMCKIG